MKAAKTQRAYTLRLKGDEAAMNALWKTHEAVNRGVKAFGDWLLTLRGGLAHTLVDLPVVEGKGDKEKKRPPTNEERRRRRIVLALSWLSVESIDGAPTKYVVAPNNVFDALADILRKRGLKGAEVESWRSDCGPSLTAAIRDDAVWVNRSAAFDDAVKVVGKSLTRDEAQAAIQGLFGDVTAFLRLPQPDDAPAASDEGKFREVARGWVVDCWGTGEKSDTSGIAAKLRLLAGADLGRFEGQAGCALTSRLLSLLKAEPGSDPLDSLCKAIGWKGRPSKGRRAIERTHALPKLSADAIATLQSKLLDEAGDKQEEGPRVVPAWAETLRGRVEEASGIPFICGRNLTDEYSVMLDHALRRVSAAHSWQKLAEAQRQGFEADARKKAPPEVERWLDAFREERARLSGAAGPIPIRRRAVEGWREVVKAWSARDCMTEEDRRQAARELQDELDKFGDISLFEALASDDAKRVWLRDGKPDPQPLLDYVYSHEAVAKMRRFKVSAYRHPDPLLHPVFCDFGKSRWSISFAVHNAAQRLKKAEADVLARQKDLAECSSAKERPKAEARLLKAQKTCDRARAEFQSSCADRGLSLKLWDGTTLKPVELVWQSKRLVADLALGQAEAGSVAVSRNDRAGRAAVGVAAGSPVTILNVFEENDWNGRLQAPRAQLERLAARIRKHGKDAKAEAMRCNLKWLVTFSARLQEQDKGPWPAYIKKLTLPNKAQAFSRKDSKGAFRVAPWPRSEANKERAGLARLDLCRLPGLRVLSVDLGHRYAAACAVWETLTEKQVAKLCADAGLKPPDSDDLFLHLLGKRGDKKMKTILRRTGPDMWARLDRQFLIKLQGEDKSPRKASVKERNAVAALESELGRKRPKDDPLPWQVCDLMSRALRTARLGLRRHGDRARIAFNLTTDYKPMPGGGREKLTAETRKELLTDTLMLWQNLFSGDRWKDDWARQLWDERIGITLPEAPDQSASSPAMRAHTKKVRALLPEVAEKLAHNPQLRQKLNALWTARWLKDDKQWVTRLRWLRNWLLPRGRKAAADPAIRRVGGLSLNRLSNIRELYQMMKAYKNRPEPDDVRKNVPEKGDTSLDKYAQRVLDTLERMRENRVKQLASRVIEAALGIGREPADGGARLTERVDQPCHAIVVENLEHYRPDQTRTRGENRRLMQWSAARVLKYLRESSELNGLYLRQVMPNYTSRQDSRTGAPGIRCTDMPVPEFLKRFQGRVEDLRKKGDAESKYLVALWDHWQGRKDLNPEKHRVRIPDDGGEIFVSADKHSPAAKGLQADLNAAANIGLRALLDPDWPGKWWWVPCDGKTSTPSMDKVRGSTVLDPSTPLDLEWKPDSKEVVNLWRDMSARPIEPGQWRRYSEYWNGVRARVIERLKEHARL